MFFEIIFFKNYLITKYTPSPNSPYHRGGKIQEADVYVTIQGRLFLCHQGMPLWLGTVLPLDNSSSGNQLETC